MWTYHSNSRDGARLDPVLFTFKEIKAIPL
jgi:hypothetical protein